MAANAFKSIYNQNYLRRRHSIDYYYHPVTHTHSSTTRHTFFLKPTHPTNLSHSTTTLALSSTTPTTPTPTPTTNSQNVSFDLLRHHLSTKNYREADEETRRLIIVLAGEPAQKRGYVFFSEVQFISEDDLKTIDRLWRQYSDDKFGYSVQKKIWKKSDRDFTKFFIKVGWMKRLDSSEVVQYNYRAFPAEFMWEMEEGTPEGHLPLTNALRGTQLLSCILSHPAFGDDDDDDGEDSKVVSEEEEGSGNGSKLPSKRTFKPNYTF